MGARRRPLTPLLFGPEPTNVAHVGGKRFSGYSRIRAKRTRRVYGKNILERGNTNPGRPGFQKIDKSEIKLLVAA